MRIKPVWNIKKNHRKENGDLGDLECSICSCKTGAYLIFFGRYICKGCLVESIEKLNKVIIEK